jgi:hypothetical protein
MRAVMAGLVMGLAWTMATTAAGAEDLATVRVRIHDYAEVPVKPLTRVQSLVSGYYRDIRVETQWQTVVQPLRDPPELALPADTQDLTVIILSSAMVLGKSWPDHAVGSAATAAHAHGRIAYVLYDRVVAAALVAGWDPVDFMSVVMAHEIGHLLLPQGSHSPDGLMRANWGLADLRAIDRRTLRFNAQQAEQMHQVALSYDRAAQPEEQATTP